MLNSIGGVEWFIAERGGQYGAAAVRGHCEVIARSLRATYLRVNHWADFDESYSDGKLSAAATPSSNAGEAIARCVAGAVRKERRSRVLGDDSAGDN